MYSLFCFVSTSHQRVMTMAADKECAAEDKNRMLQETRKRFKEHYLAEKSDLYDVRDVERLQKDDSWLESFLLWRHNVVDETLKMIDDSFQWRKEFAVNDLSESVIPKWCFETGAVYLHGYDKEGNKLFWFRVKLHLRDAKTHLEKKKCVAFWLERYAKREPGKAVTVVFDMAETGLSNVDMDFVRFIINCFKVYYPKYLSKMVIFEMPWIMNAAFKVIKSWLGPEAISMLKFTNRNEVQEYISIEYLPPHMGGSDPFRYSYPPLPDDDFQTPMCENGPIACEDEVETKDEVESDNRDVVNVSQGDEQVPKPKKVNCTEECSTNEVYEKADLKSKHSKKQMTVFKGSLLHISPAEELHFGSRESGERKCSIFLTNVTKNPVAFKVRTTAPEKYRVKPSNNSCEPGTSMDISVSLHGGFSASPQDRFLVMALEMDQSSVTGSQELAQFWKDVPRNLVMEHRLQCHVVENSKPSSLLIKESANSSAKTNEDVYFKVTQLLEVNRRLEEQMHSYVWYQQLLLALVALLVAISFFEHVF